MFHGGSSWAVNRSDECRQYSFFFVITQFLQHSPKSRQRGDLMNDMGVFLNNMYVSEHEAWLRLGLQC
jgi:hypothetical protein